MSEFWWGVIWLTLFIPLMFLWAFALWDVFSRHDLSGWAKALWVLAILVLPVFGVLVYFIARPKELDQPGGYGYGSPYAYPYGSTYQYRPEYDRASGPTPDMRDLETIERLHDTGTLSDDEYRQLKERIGSSQPEAA